MRNCYLANQYSLCVAPHAYGAWDSALLPLKDPGRDVDRLQRLSADLPGHGDLVAEPVDSLVQRVDTDERAVALTFDDGPERRYLSGALRTLEEHDARGTLFVIDASCRADPRALEALAEYVTERVRTGSIVLVHPWYESLSATRRALPLILERLAARGYRFVTLRPGRLLRRPAGRRAAPPAAVRRSSVRRLAAPSGGCVRRR